MKPTRHFRLVTLCLAAATLIPLHFTDAATPLEDAGAKKKERTMAEVKQLSAAMEKFQKELGFYPPSRLLLNGNRDDYGKDGLDLDSLKSILRMFPRTNWKDLDWGYKDGTTLR